jgi:hypothetical protein
MTMELYELILRQYLQQKRGLTISTSMAVSAVGLVNREEVRWTLRDYAERKLLSKTPQGDYKVPADGDFR